MANESRKNTDLPENELLKGKYHEEEKLERKSAISNR